DTLSVSGTATLANLTAGSLSALSGTVEYAATVPSENPATGNGRVDTTFAFVSAFGRELRELTASAQYDAGRISANLNTALAEDAKVGLDAAGTLDVDRRELQIDALTFDAGPSAWRLDAAARPAISWT